MHASLPTHMAGNEHMNFQYHPQYNFQRDDRSYEDAHMGNTNMRRRGNPPVWGRGLNQNRNNSYGPAGQGGK